MTDTAKQTPLWRTMQEATLDLNATVGECYASEIRAIMDWLVPEEPLQEPYINSDLGWIVNTDRACQWAERQRIRSLLTVEAERAERSND